MPQISENEPPTALDVMSSYINGRMAIARGEVPPVMRDDEPGDFGWRRMVRGMLEEAQQKQDVEMGRRKEAASAAARELFGGDTTSSGTSFAERLDPSLQGNVENRAGDAPMSRMGVFARKAASPFVNLPGNFMRTFSSGPPPATGLAKEAGLGDIQGRLRRRPQSWVLGRR